MKLYNMYLVAFAVLVLLAGCGGTSERSSSTGVIKSDVEVFTERLLDLVQKEDIEGLRNLIVTNPKLALKVKNAAKVLVEDGRKKGKDVALFKSLKELIEITMITELERLNTRSEMDFNDFVVAVTDAITSGDKARFMELVQYNPNNAYKFKQKAEKLSGEGGENAELFKTLAEGIEAAYDLLFTDLAGK